MCFSSPAPPENPAPYSLDQSHTAVETTKAPVDPAPDTPTTTASTKPPTDRAYLASVAGGSGANFRM